MGEAKPSVEEMVAAYERGERYRELIPALIVSWRERGKALADCEKVRDEWCKEYTKVRDAARGWEMTQRTIYDRRHEILLITEREAGNLYSALKNLLEAVNERHDLRDSIESIVISDAASTLLRIDAALAAAAGEKE